jgi:AcrR family transcriptional regulator
MKKTEEKILKAATKLFSEKGYSNTSTKKIAEVAGVNEVTIFRTFKTKSKVLQEVIRHFSYEGNIIQKISSEITGDLKQDMYIFAHTYYMFLVNNIKLYKIQVREMREDGERFTNSIDYVDYMVDYLNQWVQKGEFTGSPQEVSTGLVAMIMGIFTLEVFSPDIYHGMDDKRLINLFVENMIQLYCPNIEL